MVSEREVMKFLMMNVYEKGRLLESDPQKYEELFRAANICFSAESRSENEVSDKSGRKFDLE